MLGFILSYSSASGNGLQCRTVKISETAVTNHHQTTNSTMQPSDWAEKFERELKPVWRSALAGDHAAYEQALQMMSRRLRGFFARRLQAMPSEVEDLVQETLMAIHLKRASYDEQYAVTSWVLAIGKYKLVDFWRRHERTDALHDDIDEAGSDDLITAQASEGTSHDLAALLQRLPDAQRTAIELTKLDGLTVAEAAQRTGASVSAVKVAVHRGMKRLSEFIKSSPGL